MLTGDQARLLGFADRGLLRPGLAADLVLFDPDRIATTRVRFVDDQPAAGRRLVTDAVGVEMSVVNGVVATRQGYSTGSPAGPATAASRLMEFLPEAAGPARSRSSSPPRARPAPSGGPPTSTRPAPTGCAPTPGSTAGRVTCAPTPTARPTSSARPGCRRRSVPRRSSCRSRRRPMCPALQQLLGGSVGSGFRSRVNEVLREPGRTMRGRLAALPAPRRSARRHPGLGLRPAPRRPAGRAAPTPTPDRRTAVPDSRRPQSQPDSRRPRRCRTARRRSVRRLGAGRHHDGAHAREPGSIPVPVGPPAPRPRARRRSVLVARHGRPAAALGPAPAPARSGGAGGAWRRASDRSAFSRQPRRTKTASRRSFTSTR